MRWHGERNLETLSLSRFFDQLDTLTLAFAILVRLESPQRNVTDTSGRATQFNQCLELELILAGPTASVLTHILPLAVTPAAVGAYKNTLHCHLLYQIWLRASPPKGLVPPRPFQGADEDRRSEKVVARLKTVFPLHPGRVESNQRAIPCFPQATCRPLRIS